MKVLKPNVAKTANVNITINPAGETFVLAITFAKNGSVIGETFEKEFVSSGSTQFVGVDVTTPLVEDDYHIFVDLFLKTSMGDIPVYQTIQQWVSWDVVKIYELADVYEAYNPKAYFDDAELENYAFEAGTQHKITVEFTNPYTSAHEFYIAGSVPSLGLDLFNGLRFFSVAAGARVTKDLEFIVGATPVVVGPVGAKIHCTTSGLTGPEFATSPVSVVENPTPQIGTIEVVPAVTSVKQGDPFNYDVKITNTTNRAWVYNFKVYLYDKDGGLIGGVVTGIGVNPYSTGVFNWTTSMVKDWGLPPVGTATIKTVFMGQTQTQCTFSITAGAVPAAKVAFVSKAWFRIPEQNNILMLRVDLKNNSGRTLTPWEFDGYIWATHRAEGWTFEAGLYPESGESNWAAGRTRSFLSEWWNMGFNPGTYDVIMGLKTYEPDSWVMNGMSYPISLGSYTHNIS
jgi:hypothetical protein